MEEREAPQGGPLPCEGADGAAITSAGQALAGEGDASAAGWSLDGEGGLKALVTETGEEPADQGWSVSTDGELTITKDVASWTMAAEVPSANPAAVTAPPADAVTAFPWLANDVRDKITSIRVENGVKGSAGMAYMFSFLPNLASFDVYNLEVPAGADLSYMFRGSGIATGMAISLADVFNQPGLDMKGMFYGSGATSVALNNVGNGNDASLYTIMSFMFVSCSRLKTVKLDNVGNGRAAYMFVMFGKSYSLGHGEVNRSITSVELSNVGNADGVSNNGEDANSSSNNSTEMWYGKSTNMTAMFGSLDCLQSANLDNVGNGNYALMSAMFVYAGTTNNETLSINITNMGNGNAPMITRTFFHFMAGATKGIASINIERLACGTNPDLRWIFELNTHIESFYAKDFAQAVTTGDNAINLYRAFGYNNKNTSTALKSFVIEGEGSDEAPLAIFTQAWQNCQVMETFKISSTNGKPLFRANSLAGAFERCYQLRDLDISGLDTSPISTSEFMENPDDSPTSLVSYTSMDQMLFGCNSLERVTIGTGFTKIHQGLFEHTTSTNANYNFQHSFDLYVYGGPQKAVDLVGFSDPTNGYQGTIHFMDINAISLKDSVWTAQGYIKQENFMDEDYGTLVSGQSGYLGKVTTSDPEGTSVKWEIRTPNSGESYTLLVYPTDFTGGCGVMRSITESDPAPWLASDYKDKITKARVVGDTYVGGDLYRMFYGMAALRTLDIAGLKEDVTVADAVHAANVTEMLGGLPRLQGLGVSNIANGTDLDVKDMFRGSTIDGSLKLTNFGNGAGAMMSHMFEGDAHITSVSLDNVGNGNDSTKYTRMDRMFKSCSKLQEINLNNVGNGRAAYMFEMFGACYTSSGTNASVTRISAKDLGNGDGTLPNPNGKAEGNGSSNENWAGEATNMTGMFGGLSALSDVDLVNVGNGDYALMSSFLLFAGTGASSRLSIHVSNMGNGSYPIATRVFFKMSNAIALGDITFENFACGESPDLRWVFELNQYIETFYAKNFAVARTLDTECVNLFRAFGWNNVTGSSGLKSFIIEGQGIDEAPFVSFAQAWQNCRKLEVFKITSTNGKPLYRPTSLAAAFEHCTALRELDLSAIDTSEIQDTSHSGNPDNSTHDSLNMDYILYDCPALESVTIGPGFTNIYKGFFERTGSSNGSYDYKHDFDLYVYGGPQSTAGLTAFSDATNGYQGTIFLMDDAAKAQEGNDGVWVKQKYLKAVSGSYQIKFLIDGIVYKTQMVGTTGLVNEPDASILKPGYEVDGWYENSLCIPGSKKFDFSVAVESNISLYATSTAYSYGISFNKNVPTSSLSQTVDNWPSNLTGASAVQYDGAWSIPLVNNSAPTRVGYTFKGWSTNASSTTGQYQSSTSYSGAAGNLLTPTDNNTQTATLYAIWAANTNTKYTVNVYKMANGVYPATPEKHERTGMSDRSITIDQATFLPAPTSMCSYANDASKANVVTAVINPNGTTVFTLYYKQQMTVTFAPGTTPDGSGTTSLSGTTTFTVDWTDDLAKVSGVTFPTASNTDAGYEHYAWKTSASGTKTYKIAHTVKCAADDVRTAANAEAIPVHENVTLTAQWSGKAYRIQLNTGDYGKNGNVVNTVMTVDDNYWGNAHSLTPYTDVPGAANYVVGVAREGYDLSSWDFDPPASGNVTAASSYGSLDKGVALTNIGNMTTTYTNLVVYAAQYTPHTFKVVLDSGSGEVKQGVTTASLKTLANARNVTLSGTAFTITYDYCDSWPTGSPAAGYSGQKLPALDKVFVRTGYTSVGWMDGSTPRGSKASDTPLSTVGYDNLYAAKDSSKTLTASWDANAYTIEYDLNGGAGTKPADTQATYDDNVTFANVGNDVAKTGYTFKGWSADAAVRGEAYEPGAGDAAATYKAGTATATAPNLTDEPNGIATVYAVWEKNTYTVSYDLNEATSGTAPSPTSATYDSNVTFADIGSAIKTGYTFKGWSDAATAQGKVFEPGEGATAAKYSGTVAKPNLTDEPNGIATVYAVWEKNTYTVSYDLNGGAGTKPADTQATYDDNVTFRNIGSATKEGHTFLGWSASSSAANATWPASDLTSKTPPNLVSSAGGSVTVYAIWQANKYNVTFCPQWPTAGGTNSGDIDPLQVTYGTTIEEPSAPTVQGYQFKGWYTDAACSGGKQWDFSAKIGADDVKLYAKWEANTISFVLKPGDAGGNDHTGFSAAYASGSKLPSAEGATADGGCGFSKKGYHFAGWALVGVTEDGPDSATSYADEADATKASYSGTVTLRATWAPNAYTIKYDLNGATGSLADTLATYDADVTFRDIDNSVSKTGYTLKGWSANAAVRGEAYEPGVGDAKAPYKPGSTASKPNLTDEPNGIATVYAVWEKNTYTIALEPYYDGAPDNGGTGSSDSYAMAGCVWDNAEAYALPDAAATGFSATGFELIGWTSDPSKYYGTGSVPAGVTYATVGGAVSNLTSQPNGTFTLYAVWSERSYTVAFDLAGADNEEGALAGKTTIAEYAKAFDDATPVKYSTGAAIPDALPTRIGYEFTGWKAGSYVCTADQIESAAEGVKVTPKELGATNGNDIESGKKLALVAQWEAKTLTVPLNVGTDDLNAGATDAYKDKVNAESGNVEIGYAFDGNIGEDGTVTGTDSLPHVGTTSEGDGVFQRKNYVPSTLWYTTAGTGTSGFSKDDAEDSSAISKGDVGSAYSPGEAFDHSTYVSLYRLCEMKQDAAHQAVSGVLYARWNPGVTVDVTVDPVEMNFYVSTGKTDFLPMPVRTSSDLAANLYARSEAGSEARWLFAGNAALDKNLPVTFDYVVQEPVMNEFGNPTGVLRDDRKASIPLFGDADAEGTLVVGNVSEGDLPADAERSGIVLDEAEKDASEYATVLDGGLRLMIGDGVTWVDSFEEWKNHFSGQTDEDRRVIDEFAKIVWTVELAEG